MRSGNIFWGLILVLFGGVLLAQNTGFIPAGVNVWTIFWPLVLVLVGVFLLLRSTGRFGSGRFGPPLPQAAREPLQDAQQATVRIHHGAGELRIDGSAAADDLFNGTFQGGLDARVQRGGSQVTADLRPPSDSFPVFAFDSRGGLDWNLGLNPSVPMSLDLEVGASRSLLNLRGTQVKDLKVQTGASATEIEFPAQAGETRARIRSGMASVDMRVPQGVAARIHASGGMASISVDTARFPQIGSEYRSPDYDTAANRLDLDVETGMGSVTVR